MSHNLSLTFSLALLSVISDDVSDAQNCSIAHDNSRGVTYHDSRGVIYNRKIIIIQANACGIVSDEDRKLYDAGTRIKRLIVGKNVLERW